jgi:elongation factor 3
MPCRPSHASILTPRLTTGVCRDMSLEALETLVRTNGNSDLDPVIPGLVLALKDQAKTNESIEALASSIFVQDVEAPALAVMLPIIKRGLRSKVRPRLSPPSLILHRD